MEKNHTTLEITESKLFDNDQPLVQPNSEPVEWDEFESIKEDDSFEMIDKTHDDSEKTLKNKKVEIDES